jgi:acetaldehyde dehydrogenase/alcohol dehydrogenase
MTSTVDRPAVDRPAIDRPAVDNPGARLDTSAESGAAAAALRALDHEQVDAVVAVVAATVRAGVLAALELAALAIEETGFGGGFDAH